MVKSASQSEILFQFDSNYSITLLIRKALRSHYVMGPSIVFVCFLLIYLLYLIIARYKFDFRVILFLITAFLLIQYIFLRFAINDLFSPRLIRYIFYKNRIVFREIGEINRPIKPIHAYVREVYSLKKIIPYQNISKVFMEGNLLKLKINNKIETYMRYGEKMVKSYDKIKSFEMYGKIADLETSRTIINKNHNQPYISLQLEPLNNLTISTFIRGLVIGIYALFISITLVFVLVSIKYQENQYFFYHNFKIHLFEFSLLLAVPIIVFLFIRATLANCYKNNKK